VAAAGQRLRDEGVDCVVVCFLHSYAYPEHESRAVEILRGILPPEVHVLSSSSVYPEFREYERFSTAVLNGALLTVMNAYLDRFTRNVGALGVASPPKVSQSSGGLMSIDMARSLPIRASLSGPAAGVLGAGVRTRTAGYSNVITLDVGGTSADVSLLRGGVPTEIHERSLAGFPLRMPVLDVNAVGAGGGSIAWIDRDGLLKVGPHSAGARPGPACYDFGGNDATVTDANVVLGRLNDTSLLDGRMPIRRELADRSIASLASQLELDPDETALGIVRVACATIVKAIRTISIERGHDPTEFSLFAFGGAGPLHATDVARELGIAQVIIPPNPGILCAEGLLNSELMSDFVKTVLDELDGDALKSINEARETLLVAASAWFKQEALAPGDRRRVWSAELRYKGQNYELSLPLPDAPLDTDGIAELAKAFHGAHETAYGFASESEPIEFVNIKVKAIGALPEAALPRVEKTEPAQPVATRRTLFRRGESRQETPVFRRRDLARGQRIPGPAIIEQLDTTVIVFPGDVCAVDDWGNLLITLN
jgi:N-methylhydantoinase A